MNNKQHIVNAPKSDSSGPTSNSDRKINFNLVSVQERKLIPSILDKLEISRWVEREPGEEIETLYPSFHQMIGCPGYTSIDQLAEHEISKELNRLLEYMKTRSIFILTFTQAAEAELYRFITTELFQLLTYVNTAPSPIKIIYDEFHPSDEYLVKKATSDFLRALFGQEAWKYQWKLWKKVLSNYKEIKKFATGYESLDLRYPELEKVLIDGERAEVSFKTFFYGVTNSLFVHRYEGMGSCSLFKNGASWCVDFIWIPEQKHID